MSAAAIIVHMYGPAENEAGEPDHPSAGWYVSFDEQPAEDDDFEGPFESYEAAEDYAKSIIEAAAVASINSMFS